MSFENNFKQFLKESGCRDDESITKKEMMDLQTAINNSKDTANLEEEKREYVRQAEEEMQKLVTEESPKSSSEKTAEEKSFSFKTWTRSKSPVDIFEFEGEILPDHREFEITFQDMPESSKKSLEIIYHNPVYCLPIPTNPKYKIYNIQERSKLLGDYHTKISELKAKLAKKSLHRAPYSKPILPSNKCKNSLLKNASQDDEEATEEASNQIPAQEFYVSRAGRQVKRKIYTEETEVDSDSDFITSVKKNKSINSDTKITIDAPFVPEENHNDEKTSTPKSVKTRKDTPRRMLPLSTRKVGRSEVLFENLVNENVKAKQKEKEMTSFERTLPGVEEAEEDRLLMEDSPVKESSVESGEENFIRKRVVPPIPSRKPIRSKKQITQEDFDKIDIVSRTPPDSPVLKQYTNLNRSLESSKGATKTKEILLNEETSLTKLDKRECPICGGKFLQSEIENHASTCGIEDEIEEFQENNPEQKKITCDLCDQVCLGGTNYEVHVKHCIAKKASDL